MLFRALYWLFVLISPAGTGKLVEMERNSRDTTLRGYQRRTVSLAQRFAHAYCPLATTAEIHKCGQGYFVRCYRKVATHAEVGGSEVASVLSGSLSQ
jgi:hypothetical protein